MELITFESKAYRELVEKINRIAAFIVKIEQPLPSAERKDIWLDSEDVARLLKISTKTLQRIRKDQLITYSKFKGRCLYRPSDVEQAIIDRVIICSPQTLEEFRLNYLLNVKQK